MIAGPVDRRKFIAALAGSAAVVSALPRKAFGRMAGRGGNRPLVTEGISENTVKTQSRLKFAVIGINHDHIHGQIEAVIRGGGEFVSFYAKEPTWPLPFPNATVRQKLAQRV
jgi:hypothetical protein